MLILSSLIEIDARRKFIYIDPSHIKSLRMFPKYRSLVYLYKQLRITLRRCSVRLTGIIFARGLSSRARAPSSCSFCEYLKEVKKGVPSRSFALRRSSQLARNTKVTENCMIISMTETVWLKLCCPNCLVLTAGCCEDN